MARTTGMSARETVMKYTKDIIYVGLFIIAVSTSIIGSVRSGKQESAEAQSLKDAVVNNTVVMMELKDEIKNVNTFLLDQQKLNGQFTEFMENEKRKD